MGHEDSQRLDALIADYLQRTDLGEHLPPHQFIAEHPEFEAQLRAYFSDVRVWDDVACDGGNDVAPPIKSALSDNQRGFAETLSGNAKRRSTSRCNGAPPDRADDGQDERLGDGTHPAIIGRYKIERMLGKGSFGIVYLAHDSQLDRPVAIKVPHRAFASSDTARTDLDEARTLARLDHPNIVAVHDVGSTDEIPCYIVSAYIDGMSLTQRIKESRPPLAETAELLATVAQALHYAHRQGMVHRDIKPDNILIDADGKPYVVDFGLAVHESAQRGRRGELAGTLAYMAPEQVRREAHRLDGRTDIWALGVILYEMLAGRRPFAGKTQSDLEDEILNRQPKPPRQVADEVPEELEQICLRCLAKDLTDRYATAADVARALRRWQYPRRRWLIGLAAMAGLLMAVLAAAYYAAGLPERDQPVSAPPLPALTGTIDVWVWNAGDETRRRITLHDSGTLPLRPGDQIRVEASLNRPAYMYLLLVDSQGGVAPIYPWAPGDWSQFPEHQDPTDRVSLPVAIDEGWKVQPPYGTETFVLLARDEPLPSEVDIAGLLTGLPSQEVQDALRAIWFADGTPVSKTADRLRGIDVTENATIDDSLLQTQQMIQEKLGPHFSLSRAVSFTSQGEAE